MAVKINQHAYPFIEQVKNLPVYLTGIGGTEYQGAVNRDEGYCWHQILFCADGSGVLKFDDITIEEIQMGEILLVSDKSSNLAPYVNPSQFELITDNSHSILDETYDDYIDMLEQIVTDPTISDTTIKHLSYKKLINRRGDSND